MAGADLRGANFAGAKFGDTDVAAALHDVSLNQAGADGLCATMLHQAPTTRFSVEAPVAGTSGSTVFRRTFEMPRDHDGSRLDCKRRIGRYWSKDARFSPVCAAPNSGRESLCLDTDFSYDSALLAAGNRRDAVRRHYVEVADGLTRRFAQLAAMPKPDLRVRERRVVGQLDRNPGRPAGPVWLNADSLSLMIRRHVPDVQRYLEGERGRQMFIRMLLEHELERLGDKAHLHEAWDPILAPEAYADGFSEAILSAFERLQQRRTAQLTSIWMTLHCTAGEGGSVTLDRCQTRASARFAFNSPYAAPNNAVAAVDRDRSVVLTDVRTFNYNAHAFVFPKPLSTYVLAQGGAAAAGGDASTAAASRFEVELAIDRADASTGVVQWHVRPIAIRQRDRASVWPSGYSWNGG